MPDLDIVNISFLLLHVASAVQTAFVALLNARRITAITAINVLVYAGGKHGILLDMKNTA
jgi:hypothetical protein